MSENSKRPHITVVGDLILDRYLIGDATKLNPEQSGVVIRVDKEEDRLGGAAAVAMIAAGLGARVTLAGVVGRDEPGHRLQQLIADHGIEPHLWIDDRPTTWKQRVVARGQLRPDRCDREVTTPIGDNSTRFLSAAPLGDVLLVSDYGKGVCTRQLLDALNRRTMAAGVSNLVDPARGRNWSDYGRADVIKSNHAEAQQECGCLSLPPLRLGRHLSDRHGCHVIVTLGSHGMVCAERAGGVHYWPADQVDVHDVCGAGDTVLAAFASRITAGDSIRRACRFAVTAAAWQTRTLGIRAVLQDERVAKAIQANQHLVVARGGDGRGRRHMLI